MTAKRSSSRNAQLCQFPFADGRKCRMPRSENHPTLCLFHALQEEQLLECQQLGAELSATLTGNFLTGTDVNFVLGKLFTALAQNRIPPRNAATLAYIAQLMLHSLPHVKDEYRFEYKYPAWKRMLEGAVTLSRFSPNSFEEDAGEVADSDSNSGVGAEAEVRSPEP